MSNYLVRFIPDDKQIYITNEDNLLQAAAEVGISVRGSCGGKGTCNRCKVLVREGLVRTMGSGKLTSEEIESGWRLACQTFPESDLVVEIPEESRLSEHKVVVEDDNSVADGVLAENAGPCAGEPCDPLFKKVGLTLDPPSLDDTVDDANRLLTALNRAAVQGERVELGLDTLRQLPSVLRQGDWEVTLALAQAGGYVEVADVLPGNVDKKYFGIAVDIGTTTVVVHLVDLETYNSVGVRGSYNRQAVFGDDVISRIIHANESPRGLEELQKAVIGTINDLVDGLVKEARIRHAAIRSAVFAGNTTMIHLFMGLDPTYIRLEPYTPAANSIPLVRAWRLGLKIHPDAWVHCLPGVASYVGGDITAGVLVSGMADSDELTLFIDVGTNGEMVLGNREWLISCSCSAGPAFEGGGIRYGMRAMQGAIEKVSLTPGGTKVEYQTVDDSPPVGICGSGLIDCMSQMYNAGIIDRTGKFIGGAKTRRIRETDEGPEFVLAWAAESWRGEDITISEAEIKNLIRSKGAVFAGIRSMLTMVGLTVEAIDRILIAGGFGRYINIREAIAIGLLPDLPVEKYTYIGNSSVKGAKMVLLSRRARAKAEELAGRITYLELSVGNTFMDEFVSALFLPHTDLSLFPSIQK